MAINPGGNANSWMRRQDYMKRGGRVPGNDPQFGGRSGGKPLPVMANPMPANRPAQGMVEAPNETGGGLQSTPQAGPSAEMVNEIGRFSQATQDNYRPDNGSGIEGALAGQVQRGGPTAISRRVTSRVDPLGMVSGGISSALGQSRNQQRYRAAAQSTNRANATQDQINAELGRGQSYGQALDTLGLRGNAMWDEAARPQMRRSAAPAAGSPALERFRSRGGP